MARRKRTVKRRTGKRRTRRSYSKKPYRRLHKKKIRFTRKKMKGGSDIVPMDEREFRENLNSIPGDDNSSVDSMIFTRLTNLGSLPDIPLFTLDGGEDTGRESKINQFADHLEKEFVKIGYDASRKLARGIVYDYLQRKLTT